MKKIAPNVWRARTNFDQTGRLVLRDRGAGVAELRPTARRQQYGQQGRKSPSTDGRPPKGVRSNWPFR